MKKFNKITINNEQEVLGLGHYEDYGQSLVIKGNINEITKVMERMMKKDKVPIHSLEFVDGETFVGSRNKEYKRLSHSEDTINLSES